MKAINWKIAAIFILQKEEMFLRVDWVWGSEKAGKDIKREKKQMFGESVGYGEAKKLSEI